MYSKVFLKTWVIGFIILVSCAKNSEYAGSSANFAALTISSISIGQEHSCATTDDGTFCWGSNFFGELGDGTLAHNPNLVKVLAPTTFTGLSGGESYNCALVGNGVQCWGYNRYGTLGTTLVASSSHATCGIDNTCSSITPVGVEQVGGGGLLTGVAEVSAGLQFACARSTAGGVVCWGSGWSGQLGDGNSTSSDFPVQVTGLTSGVTAIATGRDHACAIVSGALQCWGENGYGQLGDNSTVDTVTPVATHILTSGVTAVALGQLHSCAIQNGAVFCWGNNGIGQIGDGTMVSKSVPTQVTGLTSGATAIAVGDSFACAIVNGGVKCWGYNLDGQMGNGTSGVLVLVPGDVTGLTSGVTAIGAGSSHACAIQTNKISCWGINTYGQLGTGTAVNSDVPVQVVEPVL